MKATSIRTIIGSLTLVLLATVPAAFGQRAIPTGGLLVHLDGIDPLNTATTWHDSSGNGLDGVASNTIFDAGVGYTFDGATSVVRLSGQGVDAAALGDSFALSVREASTTTSGLRGLIGGADSQWVLLALDYRYPQISYESYDFNGGVFSYMNSSAAAINSLGTSEHQIGLTWVADSAGSMTGTARLYVDGSFVTEQTGFHKQSGGIWYKDNIYAIGAGEGYPGFAPDFVFQGNIDEAAVYSNFSGTPDALMSSIFNATAVPEPSTVALIVFGALGTGAMVRRRRSRHD